MRKYLWVEHRTYTTECSMLVTRNSRRGWAGMGWGQHCKGVHPRQGAQNKGSTNPVTRSPIPWYLETHPQDRLSISNKELVFHPPIPSPDLRASESVLASEIHWWRAGETESWWLLISIGHELIYGRPSTMARMCLQSCKVKSKGFLNFS